MSVARKLYL